MEMILTIFKNLHFIKANKLSDFDFNWKKIFMVADKVYAMIVNHKLIGLIGIIYCKKFLWIKNIEINRKYRNKKYGSVLVSFASYLSMNTDDDEGFVCFKTKTNGVQNFYKKLGIEMLSNRRCIVSDDLSKHLIKEFEPKGGFKIC